MANFVRGEEAERLKVIAVIAKREDFAAKERPGKHRQREKCDQAECESTAHFARRAAVPAAAVARLARSPMVSPGETPGDCGRDARSPLAAQKSWTISRVSRVPCAKKFARMRSSFACTVSA